MPRSSYDVVVIGRDLTATITATLLAQRGVRVLAVSGPNDPIAPPLTPGQPPAPTDRYNLGPYVLPASPMALTGPDAPGLRRIIAELNLVQLFRRRIEANRPSFQLLYPDQRLDVDDDLLRALEREAPLALAPYEQAAARTQEVNTAVESILSEDVMLPPDGFWDRRDGKRVASRLPDDAEDLCGPALDGIDDAVVQSVVRGLIALPARFATDLAEPGAIAIAHQAAMWRAGSYRIDGGREGLRALFVDRLRAIGGEHRPELRATRLVWKRGKVVGVDVGGSEGEVGSEQVIAGMSADQVMLLLGDEKPSKRLLEASQLKPALYRYHLHLVVPMDVLPDALGRVAFSVRDPQAALADDNALALHLADGYGQHAVLSAEALTADPSTEALARLRKRVRRHLAELLPFIDRHVLLVHSPHDGLPPEGGPKDDTFSPRAMEPLWPITAPLLGFCGVPYDSGMKGLLLGSRQALPGLGVEGEIEAAARLAKLAGGGSKKREPTGVLR
ncbi:MAG: hypothetical protein ABI321_23575 [Polyangia bacterium]